ncbi:MAG: dinitrogenase iron-molybdenum cofactor biosynthesis protein [Ruminococcaceae bacterium]|nr:dinitrogenase iron-molybdenum cofactor biosynthesis protein [Oscillospiraceae bacterium]
MKIAVTYENGNVFGHFGHAEQFKIYEIENGAVVASEVVDTNGSGHGALAQFLCDMGVNALICGGVGMGARIALDEAGIKLMPGVSGSADDAVQSYISGTLNFNPDAQCNHHHESGHECEPHECGGHCGEDKHGCGGNH